MSQIPTELLQDCSTREAFCFTLNCAECGTVWRSRPVRFSRAGVEPSTEGKRVIFDTLYQREKEAALLRAVAEARKAFNQCPICRRLVCDHCFLICEELDLCTACAARLQEQGSPVVPVTGENASFG